MKGVLFVVLATTSGSEKAINSTAVPMATEQLCNAAKEKLTQAYRKTQTPNYLLVPLHSDFDRLNPGSK